MSVTVEINGEPVTLRCPPATRLATALRETLGLRGTKIGCDAGDCGACTVLVDGAQACACLLPVGRLDGRKVTTIEGIERLEQGRRLVEAFHAHGAAQCGICTPGMMMAAADLLLRSERPSDAEIESALGGVLCRCTGYRKIIRAVAAAAAPAGVTVEEGAFGARIPRLDGLDKIRGRASFGADIVPEGCLELRLIRSPHHRARFTLGDLDAWRADHPVVLRVLTAADVPGRNAFGIYPDLKDQPVLAEGLVRHRGEPVLALIGEPGTLAGIDPASLPIDWQPEEPVLGLDAALAGDLPPVHERLADNVLTRGNVRSGDVEEALARSAATVGYRIETSFVEHAYIEPEAGLAERHGDGVVVTAATQAPYMDRDEIAAVLGLPPERVRVVPTACGGGFGGKLDVSVQPVLALAAWITGRPVRCVYSRPESMAASTKRHPARIEATLGVDASGRLTGLRFHGDFDTGAYASWGPTVASRVPVHATGPYRIEGTLCTTRALHSNGPPAGAFRGFGVPQSAIVHEALMDRLADRLAIDRLEFRLLNALRNGDATHCGQTLAHGVGMIACLERLQPIWHEQRRQLVRAHGPLRRGLGIACMWYGLGNTSISNPSAMEVGLAADGRLTLYNGAVDIGQGTATIMVQICAEALGLPVSVFDQVLGDTEHTRDAGKTSASRQTLVSGNAARLAGLDLRARILRLVNAGPSAELALDGQRVLVREEGRESTIDLARLEPRVDGDVLRGEGFWDPPTTALDADGHGVPYAAYGFAAQMARVAVDIELGTVKVERIWAAHDVGRPVNPTLCEGQIEGGIAQGIGWALMEEYVPGVNENLHDYLIPTIGDVPEIEIFLISSDEPLAPFGAKGVGEPALVPTAPAIFGAIDDAVGVRPRKVPLTPDRLLAELERAIPKV